jgi:hypothetical protein
LKGRRGEAKAPISGLRGKRRLKFLCIPPCIDEPSIWRNVDPQHLVRVTRTTNRGIEVSTFCFLIGFYRPTTGVLDSKVRTRVG